MTDLVKCPECYSDIDARARTCPNCNKKIKKGAKYHVGSFIGAIGLLATLIGVFTSPGAAITGIILLLVGIIISRS